MTRKKNEIPKKHALIARYIMGWRREGKGLRSAWVDKRGKLKVYPYWLFDPSYLSTGFHCIGDVLKAVGLQLPNSNFAQFLEDGHWEKRNHIQSEILDFFYDYAKWLKKKRIKLN